MINGRNSYRVQHAAGTKSHYNPRTMIKFTKMHGIGNDYVYVNGFQVNIDDPKAMAIKMADRHYGIGGDGLILVLPPEAGVNAQVRMRMFNADGSESEMCGNGVRCVAKYAFDHQITDAKPMLVQTGNGVLPIDYTVDSNGKMALATVNMGKPILESAKVPVRVPGVAESQTVVDVDAAGMIDWSEHDIDSGWVEACGLDFRITCVSMGNPHVMLFCKDVAAIPLEAVGALFERHAWFPNRINVHFVQIHSRDEVTMRTWERGTGITLACGTGASAVCVAGALTNRTNRKVLAHLPGGDLTLDWRDDDHLYMTGSATEVFSGEWPE